MRTFIWSQVLSSSNKNKKSTEILLAASSNKGDQNAIKEPSAKGKTEQLLSSETKAAVMSSKSSDLKDSVIHSRILSVSMDGGNLKGSNQKIEIDKAATSVAAETDDKSKEKVNLENIKEQSLEKEKPKPILSSEPLQKLKDKLLDLKKDDTKATKSEPGKCSELLLFKVNSVILILQFNTDSLR